MALIIPTRHAVKAIEDKRQIKIEQFEQFALTDC